MKKRKQTGLDRDLTISLRQMREGKVSPRTALPRNLFAISARARNGSEKRKNCNCLRREQIFWNLKPCKVFGYSAVFAAALNNMGHSYDRRLLFFVIKWTK